MIRDRQPAGRMRSSSFLPDDGHGCATERRRGWAWAPPVPAPRLRCLIATRKEAAIDLYDVMRTTFAAREYTGEELTRRSVEEIATRERFDGPPFTRRANSHAGR